MMQVECAETEVDVLGLYLDVKIQRGAVVVEVDEIPVCAWTAAVAARQAEAVGHVVAEAAHDAAVLQQLLRRGAEDAEVRALFRVLRGLRHVEVHEWKGASEMQFQPCVSMARHSVPFLKVLGAGMQIGGSVSLRSAQAHAGSLLSAARLVELDEMYAGVLQNIGLSKDAVAERIAELNVRM